MKRLLAYLFIVFGFGLVFSINAEAGRVFCVKIYLEDPKKSYKEQVSITDKRTHLLKAECYRTTTGPKYDLYEISKKKNKSLYLFFEKTYGKGNIAFSSPLWKNLKLANFKNLLPSNHRNYFSKTFAKIDKLEKTKLAKKESKENELLTDPDKIADLISKAKNPEPDIYSFGDSNEIVSTMISNKISSCLSLPMGLPVNEKNLIVKVKLLLDYDGSVFHTQILDQKRLKQPGQEFYKVLSESVLRAIQLCAPYKVNLIKDREIIIKVDARNILFGTPSIEDKKTEIAKGKPSQTQEMDKNIKFCVNNHRSYDTKTNEYKYKIRRFDNPYYTCNSNFIIDQNYKDELFYAYLVDTIGIVEEKNFRTLEPLGYWKPKIPIKQKKKVKIAKVEESKQEEFKPEDKDNDAPIIEIAENITVNDSNYEIKGKVIDKSKKLFVQVDGETIVVKDGKFSIPRFSPIDEQLKIVAIDQWGNKSKPKIVNVTVDIKETIVADKLEQLNPSLIKSRSNKNRVALIIGIEKYEQTPAANFANLDAQYFYEYARKGFGIPKANIKLLVDEDASLIKSISTINKWLPSKIKNNQTELIIFFAGHGLASNNGEELYILPQDSDPDLLSRTALSRTELFEQIIKLNPKSVTMFMDTCYSGISRDEKMLLASARPIRIVADDQEGIPDNFTIFTASKLDQISSGLKEAEHGIFSYYLMKGLEGKADSNQDKKITNGELLSYMDDNVSQKAAELGREQNPSLSGDPDKVLISYR